MRETLRDRDARIRKQDEEIAQKLHDEDHRACWMCTGSDGEHRPDHGRCNEMCFDVSDGCKLGCNCLCRGQFTAEERFALRKLIKAMQP